MTSARWQAITEIFAAALNQPEGARGRFVREACAGDSELEADVAKLLLGHEGAGSFMERPPFSAFSMKPEIDAKASRLAVGTLISGRFEILQFIGQGGMGQVYKVLDLELGEPVALKTIRPDISSDPSVLSRFRREVQLTRRITHPNVCRTFDIERHMPNEGMGLESEFIFLTMELLEGETLTEMLRREGQVATTDALPLVLQMIKALGAAHNVGVVHRDLKPSNVVLVPSSAGIRLVVTDFGLAHAVKPDGQASVASMADTVPSSKGLMGTLTYMAPEQLERGEATKASDIYSLGLVMFEMVTGERPFADPIPFAEGLKRIKQTAPSPKTLLPDLDANWEAAISKCLYMDPCARFQDVWAVAERITGDKQNSAGGSWRKRSQPAIDGTGLRKALSSQRFVGLVFFLIAVALFGFLLRHYQVRKKPTLTVGSTMLLTDILNNTGDQRFDGTTELVRRQLAQSPYFNLLETGRIQDVLGQMNRAPNSSLEPSVAREVALRTGSPRVIFGGVSRIGDNYVLDIVIEQPDNNPNRVRAQWENHWTWNARMESSGKEIPASFLGALRNAGDWVRREAGESANDIARVDAPPEDVTTSSWAALTEFSQAERFKAAGQADSAVVALKNAVAEDPQFALAYMRLGDLLISLNRYEEGYQAYQLALSQERQQRLTRREKDRLRGIYAHDTSDFGAAEAAFRDYTVYYPNDYTGWFYRAYPLMMLGRPEEAITSLKKAAAIDPTKMFAPAHIARFDLILSNFDDASKWIQHLRDTSHSDDAYLVEGEADFLQDRYAEADADFDKLKESKDPLYRSYGYSLSARVSAELGRYDKALKELNQGIEADLEFGDSVHRADKLLDRSYIDLKQQHYAACRADAEDALILGRSFQRSMLAASILGRAAAESDGAERMSLHSSLRNIHDRLPKTELKPISDSARPRVVGEILLANGNYEGALEQFRRAGSSDPPIIEREYLARGLIAVARHANNKTAGDENIDQALAEYRKTTARPGQVWQWALDYPPGYLSDQEFSEIELAFEFGRADSRIKGNLDAFLGKRAGADRNLPDVKEARRLSKSVIEKTIQLKEPE